MEQTGHVEGACWGPAQGGYEEVLLNTLLPAFLLLEAFWHLCLCSRGVSQWVVQRAIAVPVRSEVCPPSSQMSLLYRKMQTSVSLQEFLTVMQHYPLTRFTSTEACFRSCIFRSALQTFDFTLQLRSSWGLFAELLTWPHCWSSSQPCSACRKSLSQSQCPTLSQCPTQITGVSTGKLNVSYPCPEPQETRSANARGADLSKGCSYMQEDYFY